MSNPVRSFIYKQVIQSLQTSPPLKDNINASHFFLKYNNIKDIFSLDLPLRTKQYNLQSKGQSLLNNNPSNDVIKRVQHFKLSDKEVISFQLDRNQFMREILQNNMRIITVTPVKANPSNIIVEFSSPNIAKPFHVGHLRSTIIGNYIANLNKFLDNKVLTINYLGDWGTQFGYIQLGLQLASIPDSAMKENPIDSLYKAYVFANNLSKDDSSVEKKARELFRLLENEDEKSLREWQVLRQYTVDELRKTYSRIGITFDAYHWESMYSAKKIEALISELEKLKLLTRDEHNRKVILLDDNQSTPLIKSDGSTLYITRDIAAAIDRFNQYKFDMMYYVVENGQSEHFSKLIKILEKMNYHWSNRLKHVKFGKIRGMSTRKGTAVLLQDILDETRAIMKERQIISPNTKIPIELDDSSTDILGVSAVIINDLKQKRAYDYSFDWNKALDVRELNWFSGL